MHLDKAHVMLVTILAFCYLTSVRAATTTVSLMSTSTATGTDMTSEASTNTVTMTETSSSTNSSQTSGSTGTFVIPDSTFSSMSTSGSTDLKNTVTVQSTTDYVSSTLSTNSIASSPTLIMGFSSSSTMSGTTQATTTFNTTSFTNGISSVATDSSSYYTGSSKSAPLSTSIPTSTLQPSYCLSGNCTGNETCLSSINTTCELQDGHACYQIASAYKGNDTHQMKVGCQKSCEYMRQSAGVSSTLVSTMRCCSTPLCNAQLLPDPAENGALATLMSSTMTSSLVFASMMLSLTIVKQALC